MSDADLNQYQFISERDRRFNLRKATIEQVLDELQFLLQEARRFGFAVKVIGLI